jgi:hypothetical protein
MNGNSRKGRAGTLSNCCAVACDDLDVPMSLDDDPVTYGSLINVLSKHYTVHAIDVPPGVSVLAFWSMHKVGSFLIFYGNPPHSDGTPAAMHVSALRDGVINNTTAELLQQPVAWVDQIFEKQPN